MQQCLSDRSDSQCISIHQCLLDGQAVSQLVCQHLSDNQTIRTSDKLLSSVSQMIRQSDNQCVRWNQTFAMLADGCIWCTVPCVQLHKCQSRRHTGMSGTSGKVAKVPEKPPNKTFEWI